MNETGAEKAEAQELNLPNFLNQLVDHLAGKEPISTELRAKLINQATRLQQQAMMQKRNMPKAQILMNIIGELRGLPTAANHDRVQFEKVAAEVASKIQKASSTPQTTTPQIEIDLTGDLVEVKGTYQQGIWEILRLVGQLRTQNMEKNIGQKLMGFLEGRMRGDPSIALAAATRSLEIEERTPESGN